MGSRSRKRRRTPGVPPRGAAPTPGADAAGRGGAEDLRPRRRRRVVVGDAAFAPRETAQRPRARGEARDALIREGLEPLAPGERPRPLVVAAGVALVFGLGNLALLAAGYDLSGREDPSAGGVVLFSAIMFAAAAGMWALRYWAVLGFECLLAITVIYAAASLAVATNVQAVVLCVAIILASGWLFWKLIRVMARLQMPRRPGDARG